jgi:uncharacterized protein (DUF362 family)
LTYVAITRAKSYEDCTKAVEEGLNLIGGLQARDPSKPIVIKPNLCIDTDPTKGANTNVAVVGALIQSLREAGHSNPIRIVESDSIAKTAESVFEKLGYKRLAEDRRRLGEDVKCIDLTKEPTTRIRLDGAFFQEVELPTILLGERTYISISKIKTHGLTTLTGTLKNQFGCLPTKAKSHFHRKIDQVILDLNRAIPCDLCIADGIVALEGVTTGTPRNLGILLLGRDPVAVDSTQARIMGFNPASIKHLRLAEKAGLGDLSPETVGADIRSVSYRFKRRDVWYRGGAWRYVPDWMYPWLRSTYNRLTGT